MVSAWKIGFCIGITMFIQTLVYSSRTLTLAKGRCRTIRPLRLMPPSVAFSSRPSANDLSLDSILISSQPELIASHLRSRKIDQDVVDRILHIKELRNERNNLIVAGDNAKHLRKTLSKDIGMLMKQKKLSEVDILKAQVEAASEESARADEKLIDVERDIASILSTVPNLLDDRVPHGHDDSDNVVIKTWGDERRKLGEGYLWHDELAKQANGMDAEAAARISGSRFSVLVGPVARLERALTQYFLDFHAKRGYTEVSVPFIVSRSTLEGTGQLPKFEDDLFKVNHNVGGEEAFMIPTAEVPVTNLLRDQLLNATDLPIRLVCSSPSFRAEAGSAGRDTRGLLRQHQFQKVEMVRICTPETSQAEHEALVGDAEALLESLELPYRRLLLCSGDTGFAARICYDLEVWLPGQQAYREISSCSNCYDFQSRRMALRYRPAPAAHDDSKDAKHKKNVYPHTLNGSGLAVGRALVAVLENYQQADGSVLVPSVLQPYMGGITIIQNQLPPAGSTSAHRNIYAAQD